jgi:hypothetical protein
MVRGSVVAACPLGVRIALRITSALLSNSVRCIFENNVACVSYRLRFLRAAQG